MCTWLLEKLPLIASIFVGKVIPLLFNTLSRFVIAFLPRSKCLLILWLQPPSTVNLEPKKIKFVTIPTLCLSLCLKVMGQDTILVFVMLSFRPAFTLSSFTLIKRLLNFFSLSAIGMISSTAYLRLLIFLPAVLIPGCGSSSPAFWMMYSAYPLHESQPCCGKGACIIQWKERLYSTNFSVLIFFGNPFMNN